MFTGLVQTVGHIGRLERRHDGARLAIDASSSFLDGVGVGDSIAVSGVCLTVVALHGDRFQVDVSHETLDRTTLGERRSHDRLNLEKALTLSTPLGGHFVNGHVDGVGRLLSREDRTDAVYVTVEAPANLGRYIAEKGSICVDGVSLTVNGVSGACFQLTLIPHTLAVTALSEWHPGTCVNLEVDLIARYLERLLCAGAVPAASGIDEKFLAEHGFLNGANSP